jgi:hypothetical protein
VEVCEAAVQANARSLRRSLAHGCNLMAVVKADGYGHGAVPVARAAAAGGASSFGVATLQEGVELRQAGLRQPVLVLGNLTQPEELRACLHWQLMPTLSGMREALLCQNLAAGSGRPMAVQLKLDTGMARLGAPWQEGRRIVEAISALEAVELAGLYSHLADADAPGTGLDPLTRQQQERFGQVLTAVQQAGAVHRQFGVDDQTQVRQVQTARGDVGGHADAGAAVTQRLKRIGALALTHFARQRHGREAALQQGRLQMPHAVAGRAEDHGARRLEPAQGEALERVDLRVGRRVERRRAHDQQRPEKEGEEQEDVEAEHRPVDEAGRHRVISDRLTLNRRIISMTKTTQVSSRMIA